jgi:hypothetical protein
LYDAIDLGFIIISASINLGVLFWMFANLDRVMTANGSMDLYLNFLGRTLGWQLLAAFAYACFYVLI